MYVENFYKNGDFPYHQTKIIFLADGDSSIRNHLIIESEITRLPFFKKFRSRSANENFKELKKKYKNDNILAGLEKLIPSSYEVLFSLPTIDFEKKLFFQVVQNWTQSLPYIKEIVYEKDYHFEFLAKKIFFYSLFLVIFSSFFLSVFYIVRLLAETKRRSSLKILKAFSLSFLGLLLFLFSHEYWIPVDKFVISYSWLSFIFILFISSLLIALCVFIGNIDKEKKKVFLCLVFLFFALPFSLKSQEKKFSQRELMSQIYENQMEAEKLLETQILLSEKLFLIKEDLREREFEGKDLFKTKVVAKKNLKTYLTKLYSLTALQKVSFRTRNQNDLKRKIKKIETLIRKEKLKYVKYKNQIEMARRGSQYLKKKWTELKKLKNKIKEKDLEIQKKLQSQRRYFAHIKNKNEKKRVVKQDKKIKKISNLFLVGQFSERKGFLNLPINSYIKKIDFGKQKKTKTLGKRKNTKVLLDWTLNGNVYWTQAQEKVRSVFQGLVLFKGPLKGYKEVVILDHGRSYYTVYAFLENIQVSQGEYVQAYKVLGRVGKLNKKENIVYFEIRHFSSPLNTNDWLVKKGVLNE